MSDRTSASAAGGILLQGQGEYLGPVQLLTELLSPGGIPSAEILSGRLIDHFGGLRPLIWAAPEELLAWSELGPASVTRLLACFELGRLAARERVTERPVISSPGDVADLTGPLMGGLKQEQFHALLLDSKHQVLKDILVAQGGLNAAVVHPREVLRPAILASAAALVLVHNHPSGDPEPSEEDLKLTTRFHEACRLIGIELLDHIVLGGGVFVSLKERGLVSKTR
ncbi:MAG: DNA repair protein RadC [bacterium]|nr:DNA repair protein RadC [bacterium]